MRFHYFFLMLMMSMVLTTSVQAKDCYTKIEAEAEQGVRIHSELMVIALNCTSENDSNLYQTYRDFTTKHKKLFSGYEELLLAFFVKLDKKDPEDQLNLLRTEFANKISNHVATMGAQTFCEKYKGRIKKAEEMSEKAVRSWASMIFKAHPVSYPLCEVEQASKESSSK